MFQACFTFRTKITYYYTLTCTILRLPSRRPYTAYTSQSRSAARIIGRLTYILAPDL